MLGLDVEQVRIVPLGIMVTAGVPHDDGPETVPHGVDPDPADA